MTSIEQSQFKRVLRVAIILPLILMGIVAGILLWQINQLLRATQWVAHTDEVIAEANLLQRLYVDMDTGTRGYLLTGDALFLQPFNRAVNQAPTSQARLSSLISDNSQQTQRINEVISLHEQWLASVRQTLTLRESGNTDATAYDLYNRKEMMDSLRARFDEFTRTEEILRDQRTQATGSQVWQATIATIVLTILLGSFLAFFGRYQLTSLSRSYTTIFERTLQQSVVLQEQANTLQEQADDLKESNARTVNILESIGDAFIAVDREWHLTYVNPRAATLLARPASELNGKVLWDEIPVLRGTIFETELQRTADERQMRRFEADFPESDRAIETSVYPSEDGLSIYFNDITERQVAERERKLAEAEQARLRESIINLQRTRLEELAAPLIPLRQGIVLMPLIGSLDSERAAQVLHNLSHGVVEHAARICILDITGVPTVDSNVAATLINAAQTVRLLGAEVVITGIRSGVAQTLIRLGVDIKGITTRSTLQSGFELALTRLRTVNNHSPVEAAVRNGS
ncbi:MAG: CHASE3 domain-containing protein [Pyrinomonadaceae bacterium MAG19_C2-C3]|nr:CHASE3 domain-containing protein [Pyrinomonadaceae bacterium MAG19_C2-C3]